MGELKKLFRRTVPPVLRKIFRTMPQGVVSAAQAVRDGTLHGAMLPPLPPAPDFPADSLVRRSGLDQDGFRDWPVFWAHCGTTRLYGRNLVPLDAQGRVFEEAIFGAKFFNYDDSCIFPTLGKETFLAGRWTSIASRWDNNYWHFLMDALPRLSLREHFPADTGILVRGPLTGWQRELLGLLGVLDRVREVTESRLRVEDYYFAAPTAMTGTWNPAAVDFLRQRLLPVASGHEEDNNHGIHGSHGNGDEAFSYNHPFHSLEQTSEEGRECFLTAKERIDRKGNAEENGCGDKNGMGSGASVRSQIHLQTNTHSGTDSAAQSSPEKSGCRFSPFRVVSVFRGRTSDSLGGSSSDLSCEALAKREAAVKNTSHISHSTTHNEAASSGSKKLYIKRGASWDRGIINEDEVCAFFEERGWRVIAPETFSVKEQIQIFSRAQTICGLHGSALTNILWAPPGCRVLELCADNYILGSFEWLARCLNLPHDFLLFPGDRHQMIEVDVEKLCRAVEDCEG